MCIGLLSLDVGRPTAVNAKLLSTKFCGERRGKKGFLCTFLNEETVKVRSESLNEREEKEEERSFNSGGRNREGRRGERVHFSNSPLLLQSGSKVQSRREEIRSGIAAAVITDRENGEKD